MSLTKFTNVESILDVRSSDQRIAFNYGDSTHSGLSKFAALDEGMREEDGYLYVRCRAISSRVNKNNDGWPSQELMKAAETFVGRPVFVDHNNDNPKRTRGVIVSSNVNVDDDKTSSLDPYYSTAPDNHKPPTWIELLIEVDANTYPKLAKAIRSSDIDSVSMGANIDRSVCSVCENEASTPSEYCSHIKQKGVTFEITSGDGAKIRKKAYEDCYGVNFFEISFVFDPADTTALISEKVGKTASSECDSCGHSRSDHSDLHGKCSECSCTRFESDEKEKTGSYFEKGDRVQLTQNQLNAGGKVTPTGSSGYVQHIGPWPGIPEAHSIQLDDGSIIHGVPEHQITLADADSSSSGLTLPANFAKTIAQFIEPVQKTTAPNAIDQFIEPIGTKPDTDNPNFIPQSDQVTAPQKVDTLRPEHLCPVCRAADMKSDPDGIERCPTCGHVQEPEPLNNPDLSQARDNDIAMENTQVMDDQGNPQTPVTDGTEDVQITPMNPVAPVSARNQSNPEGVIGDMFTTLLTTESKEQADAILPARVAGAKRPILKGSQKPTDQPKGEKVISDEFAPREAAIDAEVTKRIASVVQKFSEKLAELEKEGDRRHIVRSEQNADGVVRSEEITEELDGKPNDVELAPRAEQQVETPAYASTEDREAKLLAAMRLADDAIDIGVIDKENKMAFIAEVEQETMETIKARESMITLAKTAGLSKQRPKLSGVRRIPRLAHSTPTTNGSGSAHDIPDEAIFLN